MALRRIHIPQNLVAGLFELEGAQAHHVRDVLRLKVGDEIEVFDDVGNRASAVIQVCDANHVTVRIEQVHANESGMQVVIASAVPKGDRADWMIEKLSELGVSRFIPLETARSVVHPTGKGKRERWMRIATEAAKQSRRAGVMQIEELITVEAMLNAKPQAADGSYFLSTDPSATPILSIRQSAIGNRQFLIGPEGGWTDEEIELFKSAGLTGVKLTGTILRVETAAVAAATVACLVEPPQRLP